jgi:hypothetical protein
MSLKRLPLDDLAVAKPVGPSALALVSDFTRFDPPDFDSPEPDHGVASSYEALREDAWLHGLISRFKPIAHLVVPAQPRPAWSLEHNLGIVQREKLVNFIPPIEEFDPPARDCDVLWRHVRTLSLGKLEPGPRGEIPVYHAGRPPRNKGMRYPADPPTVDEIVAVMRHTSDDRHGWRLRATIVVLWRAGLRNPSVGTLRARRAGSTLRPLALGPGLCQVRPAAAPRRHSAEEVHGARR